MSKKVVKRASILAVLAATAAASVTPAWSAAGTVGGFSFGQLQAQVVGATGCGTNTAGEPSIHVSKSNLVGLGSENGLGGGSVYWRGGSTAGGCGLEYRGQPNADGGVGLSGGDIDTAFAPVKSAAGTYRIYVASLNLLSINVATSTDNGTTFSQTPVQAGIPADDREWIAAYGPDTSLLTYHDVATNNIDVLRSDTGGGLYTQISQAIPATDYKAMNNELGNIVIDHNSGTGTATSNFDAYQSFVAPATDPGPAGGPYNRAFLAVSRDGGHTWADKPIPCSANWGGSLNHQFPNVSVSPSGRLWYTASNDRKIFVATSADKGNTWVCSGAVTTVVRAVMPWIVAGSAGEDLVYYGTPDPAGATQEWYVYFAQNLSTTRPSAFTSTRLMPVHLGQVCEGGVGCTGGRQLLDDFGVDTDQQGYAHIAYSHDAPDLGGTGSYTGYAKQLTGSVIGPPN